MDETDEVGSEKAGLEKAVGRRAPAQRRSRERLDRILEVASELIAAVGSEQVRMSEIADRAGISIGSLYQYFPDKRSIVRTLAARHATEGRECVRAALESVRSVDDLRAAYEGLVDTYYRMFQADPVLRDVWSGTQADKALEKLEFAESRACGELLAAAMERVAHGSAPGQMATGALVIWQLGEATMRLATLLGPEEADASVATFKRMSWREMLAIIEGRGD